jgi:hypothetical protein
MYVRMLMTGEPLDDALLVRCVDLVMDGIATRPREGAAAATSTPTIRPWAG